jgi:putative SOS response-associated peptidase YedK
MCGRFTNRLTWRQIVALYRLTVPATPERNLPARYNICPTQTIDTVAEQRELVPMRWGLVLLQPGDFDGWLTGKAGTEVLKPAPDDYLQVWPVSKRVNSSRAPGDDPTLIDPVAA